MTAAGRRILIVDDEAPARERLERLVAELQDWSSAGSCATGMEAIERVEADRPSVVLLDVRMPEMNGIEVARHLSRMPAPPAVIFTTAYDQYAVEAFDARAVGYLLKPVRLERLRSALTHAARLADALLGDINLEMSGVQRRKHLAARVRDALKLIPIAEIRYFRADQKYVTVFHARGQDLVEDSLKQLEAEFSDVFVRIHRNALVAMAAIDAIERDAAGGYHVRLRGERETLPVSRRQVTDLKVRVSGKRRFV